MEKNKLDIQTTRIDWVDIAKGYGILFVIFAHLGVGSIGTWIYTFHMPLFFFLSGYVFSTKYEFKTFIKRKCKSIIIPYFSLGIVMIVFQILLNCHSDAFEFRSSLLLFLKLIVQRRFWTLWYIACLFWLNIVFYGLVKKIQSMKFLCFIVICMLIAGLLYYHFGGIPLPWNVDVIFPSILFFFTGYWFKSNYSKFQNYLNSSKSIIVFLLMGIVNVCFGYFGVKISGKGMEMYDSSYGFPPLTLISAFAGIICVVIFAHWFNIKCIKYIGKNSMVYYAWHQTIMTPLVRFGLHYIGISSDTILNNSLLLGKRICELLIIIILSTLCHLFIDKTKLRFMIGH